MELLALTVRPSRTAGGGQSFCYLGPELKPAYNRTNEVEAGLPRQLRAAAFCNGDRHVKGELYSVHGLGRGYRVDRPLGDGRCGHCGQAVFYSRRFAAVSSLKPHPRKKLKT